MKCALFILQVLTSTLNINWPIHLQSLKVLSRMIKEKMHLQEKKQYLTFDLGHRKCCTVPSSLCELCACKVWSKYIKWLRRCIYKKIHSLTLTPDPRSRSNKNVAQFPLHHVIYAPAEIAIYASNSLGEDAFTRIVTEGGTDRLTLGCCPF